jgi:hypothetical protein
MTNNREFADRESAVCRKAPGGSLERRAAGCVAVAAGTAATVAAARQALQGIGLADVREAALMLLEDLASVKETT